MGKESSIKVGYRKKIIGIIVVLIIVLVVRCCLTQNERVEFSPVKIKLSPIFENIELSIVDDNVLDIKSNLVMEGDFFHETVKLSDEECREFNIMIQNIIANKDKVHNPLLRETALDDLMSAHFIRDSDYTKIYRGDDRKECHESEFGTLMKVTLGNEEYLSVYGDYLDKKSNELDWFVCKLLKKSPIDFKFEKWVKISCDE